MTSVQWPNIIVWLDGLICCLLMMEESLCCILLKSILERK